MLVNQLVAIADESIWNDYLEDAFENQLRSKVHFEVIFDQLKEISYLANETGFYSFFNKLLVALKLNLEVKQRTLIYAILLENFPKVILFEDEIEILTSYIKNYLETDNSELQHSGTIMLVQLMKYQEKKEQFETAKWILKKFANSNFNNRKVYTYVTEALIAEKSLSFMEESGLLDGLLVVLQAGSVHTPLLRLLLEEFSFFAISDKISVQVKMALEEVKDTEFVYC